MLCFRSNGLTASQFVALHDTLNDPGSLPPKRILATTFVPSAWLDDTLITERKAGLSAYLTGLLQSPQFRAHKFLLDFLTPSQPSTSAGTFSMEDALPSTLSRKAALEAQSRLAAEATTPIAAAYYPDWSSDSNPPSSLDFSKFDILLFGASVVIVSTLDALPFVLSSGLLPRARGYLIVRRLCAAAPYGAISAYTHMRLVFEDVR